MRKEQQSLENKVKVLELEIKSIKAKIEELEKRGVFEFVNIS